VGSSISGTAIRFGAGVVCMAAVLLSAGASPLQAQDGYNQGGSTAPEGVWVGGGLNTVSASGTGIRLEIGIPLKVVGPGMMALVIPASTWHRGSRFCDPFSRDCMSWRQNALYAVPEVQWEYVLPIRMKHRFSIIPAGGIGFAMYWTYFDDFPGRGTDRDVVLGMAVRTAAAARFGFLNGVFVQVQPVGLLWNIAFDGRTAVDPIGGGTIAAGSSFWVSYEFYAMAGYRWN
jgi:hypothetical protein